MSNLPKIFVFVDKNNHAWGRDYVAMAVSQDGYLLASHISSSESWARHDMGLGSDWKHELYDIKYPNGYQLEWVEDPDSHQGLLEAQRMVKNRHDEGKAKPSNP